MEAAEGERLAILERFVGSWSIEPLLPDREAPSELRGTVTFEWLRGGGFLLERWEVPIPDVPNGIAVIGAAPEGRGFLQYQFDSRGVARIYSMALDGDMWRAASRSSGASRHFLECAPFVVKRPPHHGGGQSGEFAGLQSRRPASSRRPSIRVALWRADLTA